MSNRCCTPAVGELAEIRCRLQNIEGFGICPYFCNFIQFDIHTVIVNIDIAYIDCVGVSGFFRDNICSNPCRSPCAVAVIISIGGIGIIDIGTKKISTFINRYTRYGCLRTAYCNCLGCHGIVARQHFADIISCVVGDVLAPVDSTESIFTCNVVNGVAEHEGRRCRRAFIGQCGNCQFFMSGPVRCKSVFHMGGNTVRTCGFDSAFRCSQNGSFLIRSDISAVLFGQSA